MATVDGTPSPEGIFSLLDTDLYKLTMQCAVLKYFPKVDVAYKFTNRTPHMRLTREAADWVQIQIDKLGNLHVTDEELAWLKETCPYLSEEYLTYLSHLRLRPQEHIKITFTPEDKGNSSKDTPGHIDVQTRGLWVETILYEIPLLALVSEAYFKFVETDWTHTRQREKAKQKGLQLLEAGCVFSEFGSRRRRDYKTHELVVQGLCDAQRETGDSSTGKFTGTSNVHMAKRFGVAPIGTVAHEWFMAIAAITDNYADANEVAMKYWIGTFGRGVLGIALTDTFGTPAFLRAFAKPAPLSGTTDAHSSSSSNPSSSERDPTYAETFTGVRQDSGDPLTFIARMRTFYTTQSIPSGKTLVFSDSLNVSRCIQYKLATEAVQLTPSFGIGTFFTNDFVHESDEQKKSVPLNIVVKISEAEGRPAVKLSDDVGKNMGDDELVSRIKREVGYEERRWGEGDEAHRWDG